VEQHSGGAELASGGALPNARLQYTKIEKLMQEPDTFEDAGVEGEMYSLVPTWFEIPEGYGRSFELAGNGWGVWLEVRNGELLYRERGRLGRVEDLSAVLVWVGEVVEVVRGDLEFHEERIFA
jgi:hypothetical protein